MPDLLTTEALMEWTGISQKARLRRWLDENGIPYKLRPDGGMCTTLGAVTESLLQRGKEAKPWAA